MRARIRTLALFSVITALSGIYLTAIAAMFQT